eukprot:1824312-Pleurochrysis_carterae.AAC.4
MAPTETGNLARNHARTSWQTDQTYLPSPQNEHKVAGGRPLHVQRVGVPRRSDLGTNENGNCVYAQTAQGLVADKSGSALCQTGNLGSTPNIASRTARARNQSQLQALMPKSLTREPKEELGRVCSDEDVRPAPEVTASSDSERRAMLGAISGATSSVAEAPRDKVRERAPDLRET